MKDSKKRRQRLAKVYVSQLRNDLEALVTKTNSFTHAERQITLATAIEVANRSLRKTRDMHPESRVFAALKAVQAHIAFATQNRYTSSSLENSDLLPVGHPLSTKQHAMTASALRHAQARWIAADPYVNDDVRALVASAYAQEPGSLVRRHAFARLSALTASDIPPDIRITATEESLHAITASFGNSEVARRLRAQLQRRDRYGRFAFMGGGFTFNLRGLDGLFNMITGRVVGASGSDSVEIEVLDSPHLPDGIYSIPAGKGEAVKAVLSRDAIKNLPSVEADTSSRWAIDASSLERMDAPSGWKLQDGADMPTWVSEDGYFVRKDGESFTLHRADSNDNMISDPIASGDSWADMQKAALGDQDAYAKSQEGASKSSGSEDKHELRRRGDSNVYDYGDGIIVDGVAGVTVQSRYNKSISSIDHPLPRIESIDDAKRAIEEWEANREERRRERMADAIGSMIKNNRDAKSAGKTGAQQWKSDVADFIGDFIAPINAKKYRDEFSKLKEMLDSGELTWPDALVEAERLVPRLEGTGLAPERTPQEWAEWAKRRHFPGDISGNKLIDDAAARAARGGGTGEPPTTPPSVGDLGPGEAPDGWKSSVSSTQGGKPRSYYHVPDKDVYPAHTVTENLDADGNTTGYDVWRMGWAEGKYGDNTQVKSNAKSWDEAIQVIEKDMADKPARDAEKARIEGEKKAAAEAEKSKAEQDRLALFDKEPVVLSEDNGFIDTQIKNAIYNKDLIQFKYNGKERTVRPLNVYTNSKTGQKNVVVQTKDGKEFTFAMSKMEIKPKTPPTPEQQRESRISGILYDIGRIYTPDPSDKYADKIMGNYWGGKSRQQVVDEIAKMDLPQDDVNEIINRYITRNGMTEPDDTLRPYIESFFPDQQPDITEPPVPEAPSAPEAPASNVIDLNPKEVNKIADIKTFVGDAVKNKQQLRFVYSGKERTVEPVSVWQNGQTGRTNLKAIEDGKQKNFSWDKIEAPEATISEAPAMSREDIRWDDKNNVYTDVNGNPLDADTVDNAGLDSTLIDAPAPDIKLLDQPETQNVPETPSGLTRDDIRWDAERGVYTDVNGNELDADTVESVGLDPGLRDAPAAGIEYLKSEQSTFDDILAQEFDSMFETPDGAYKPNIYEPYQPEGRTNQDSFDYTDDPAVLANTFSQAELTRALSEAVLADEYGDASGYGNLPFEAGDEAVKAEAIYEALNQSADGAGDKVLAALYDSELPDDREMTNLERVNMLMEDMSRDYGEELPKKEVSGRDNVVIESVKQNRVLATPTRAQRAYELMSTHQETNPKINDIANDLMSRQDNGDGYDSINLQETFTKYFPWSKSNDPQEREAFSALWGTFMSLDGGSSEEDLTPENLADGEAFRTILYNSLVDVNGGDEDLAMDDYENLVDTYGGMPEFVAGKEAIANGEADLNSDSSAAAFYRLVKASSRPNEKPLYRSIGVANNDPLLDKYLTEGTVFSMDARSFTATDISDGSFASQMFYPAGSGETRVIFSVPEGQIDSVDASTISWFSGENEHFGYGTFEVASVKKQKGLGGKTDEYVVELRRTAPAVETPTEDGGMSYSDIEGWKRVSKQLGSNPGGIFEDSNGNRYYVKVPKSPSHAQNESLASALYKELGIDAVEVNLGFSDGELRTVSPIVPNSSSDFGYKLDDPEYMKKVQEGFAIDAWLSNWDVAGLTYDNVITDGNGNPVRVDPGGALKWRAQGAPKGKLFGDTVGELDTLRDPDMNPQSASVFGSMTDAQIEDSARKLLDITPDRIDEIVDSIVTDPEEAAFLKERLKARREDILGRYGIEEANLFQEATPINTEGDVERPKLPDNPADPEAMKQYRQQLADYQAAKAVADAWNCDGGGGITAAGDNPCNIPTADELISSVADDGPLDPDVVDSADKMIVDLLDFMEGTQDENLKASTKKKIKEVSDKLEEIQQGIKDGTISKAAGIQMLNDLAASIPTGGNSEDAITLESIQDIVSEIRRTLDGTINDRVDTPDLPPVKSGKGYAKDGKTFLRPGMRVRTKWGYAGTVDRYDKNSWQVWVTMDIDPSGKHAPGYKKMSFSTKTLEFIDPETGDDTPWIDLPGVPDGKKPKDLNYTPVNFPPKGSAAEKYSQEVAAKIAKMGATSKAAKSPKAEAPEGAPEVPEVATPEVKVEEPSAPETPEVSAPEASSIPDPVTKFDKGKVTGTGAKKVIVENPPSFEYSAFAEVPSMRGALDSLTDENVKFAKVRGASAAFDGGDIEDLEVRVEGIVDEQGNENVRMSYKLTAWAGDALAEQIESGDGEWDTTSGVTIPRTSVDDKTGAILIKNGTLSNGVYDTSGRTYTADLGNGIQVTFRRTSAGHAALHNYVTIDMPYGSSDEDIARAMNIAGVNDPRPATKTDFRVLAENRLMSIFSGNTNAASNVKTASTRDAKLTEIQQKYGITPDDVSIRVGPSGQIETVIPEEVGQKIAQMTNADTLEHDFNISSYVAVEARKRGVDASSISKEERRQIIIDGLVDFFVGPRGGGLISTRQRYFTGMQVSGMSSSSDLGTGGADYVFLRPSNGGQRHKSGVFGDFGAELAFDAAKAYTRLDWYANRTDKYGKRSTKTDVISNAHLGAYEVMFKKRLGLESLRSLALNEDFRKEVLAEFDKRGIKEIYGRPVEEVIVIAGRPDDPTGKIAKATQPLTDKLNNLGAYGTDFGDVSYTYNDLLKTQYPYPPYGTKIYGTNSDMTKLLTKDSKGQYWIYDGKSGKKTITSVEDIQGLLETVGTPDSEFSLFSESSSKTAGIAVANVAGKLNSGEFTPEEAARSLMGILRQGPSYSTMTDIRKLIIGNQSLKDAFGKLVQGEL